MVNRAGATMSNNVVLSVQQVAPAIPPGIVFEDVRLSRNEATLLRLARLRVSPGYLATVMGTPTLHFSGDLHGGRTEGVLRRLGKNPTTAGEIRFEGVDLAQLSIITESLPERSITGRISGVCRIDTPPGGAARMAVETVVTEATVGLLLPIGDIRSIALDRIETKAVVTATSVTVSSCEWASPLLNGSLSGTIGIQAPIGASTIAMSGNIRPQPALIRELGESMASRIFPGYRQRKNAFQISFSGTLAKPTFDIK